MLQFMRKQAKNWLMKILLIIIIVVFIFYFGSMRGHKDSETLASVDGKVITYAEFRQEYQNAMDAYRQLYGNLTDENLKKLNLKQQVLDSMINQAVIALKAKDFNIHVSDDEVRQSILSYPAFQREGVFDSRIYQQTLRHFKMTAGDFEESQKRRIAAAKLENLIKGAAKVSDEELSYLYRIQNEKINIDFIRITPGEFTNRIKPTEEDLEKYLKEHGEDFRVPERIQVKYLFFPAADYAAGVRISDDEVRDYYNQHRSRFAGKGKEAPPIGEVRDKIIAEIKMTKGMDRASEAAKKAQTIIYQTDNLDDYAAKNSLKVHLTGFFPKNRPPEELAHVKDAGKYLAALEKDDLSPVIAVSQGFYLMKVTGLKPSYIPGLAEAREEVRKRYIENESLAAAKKEAEKIFEQLKKGEDFRKVAQSAGLRTGETGLFLPGVEIPKIGQSRELAQALFQISEKHPYPDTFFNSGGDYILIRFKSKSPLDTKDFGAKKEAFRNALLRIKENMYFQSWIEETKASMTREGKLKISKDASDI